jgi:hypothetical protein
MKELSGDYWERLYSRTQEVLRLDEGEFDESQNEVERACLGTAVVCEPQAVNLALVGDLESARYYFGVIEKFALLGYKNDERYVYEDASGKGLFAKYSAMRSAALGAFFFGESERDDYLRMAIQFLEGAIAEAQLAVASIGFEELAVYLVHLAQLSEWEKIRDIVDLRKSEFQRRDVPWGAICGFVSEICRLKISGIGRLSDSEKIRLDSVFSSLMDVDRFEKPVSSCTNRRRGGCHF